MKIVELTVVEEPREQIFLLVLISTYSDPLKILN